MTNQKDLETVARKFIAFLEVQQVEYALVGGFAVRLYGLPRATYDVDFAISIGRDQLESFYTAADRDGFDIPEFQRTGWMDTVGKMSLVKLQCPFDGNLIDIDLFLAESAFLQSLLKRRKSETAEGFTAWYATPEDIILLKLDANRSKDRGDIEDILLVQGELDAAYMRTWARRMGTLELLNEVLQKSLS